MVRQITISLALLALVSFLAALSAGGCNTVKGAGQDMSSVGGHVEHAAEQNGAR